MSVFYVNYCKAKQSCTFIIVNEISLHQCICFALMLHYALCTYFKHIILLNFRLVEPNRYFYLRVGVSSIAQKSIYIRSYVFRCKVNYSVPQEIIENFPMLMQLWHCSRIFFVIICI